MIQNTEKLLSIIIPTYNMEALIGKCLDSLIIPEIDMLDIMVINDGSKDNSSQIAHGYESRYPESIRVIDKENGNYGSCVNRGLKEAKGKYVKVLDADDTFNTSEFSSFVQELSKIDADCVISDYCKVDPNGKILTKIRYKGITPIKELSLADILDILSYKVAMHAVSYKTSMLREINYSQTEGVSYTDMEWVYLPVAYAKSFVYLPHMVYQYMLGREGQTVDSKVAARHFNDAIVGIKKQTELAINAKDLNKNQQDYINQQLKNRILRNYLTVLSAHDDRLQELSKLDSDYNNIWECLGIDIEKETKIPIIGKSYIRDWRKNKHPSKLHIHTYRTWIKIQTILNQL